MSADTHPEPAIDRPVEFVPSARRPEGDDRFGPPPMPPSGADAPAIDVDVGRSVGRVRRREGSVKRALRRANVPAAAIALGEAASRADLLEAAWKLATVTTVEGRLDEAATVHRLADALGSAIKTGAAPRPEFLTAPDVARMCAVDIKTIHNWCDRGRIPFFKTPGGHLRFRPEEVRAFLVAHGFARAEASC